MPRTLMAYSPFVLPQIRIDVIHQHGPNKILQYEEMRAMGLGRS